MIGLVTRNLARVAFYRGDLDQAETLWKDSLKLLVESGTRTYAISRLGDLGLVAHARGDSIRAARLFGSCKAIGKTLTHVGERGQVVYHPDVENEVPRYEADFPGEWQEGQGMTFEKAVEYALEG